MNSPRFIVLEGIDGSGTTTQVSQLAENLRLRGHRVRTTFEPSPGRIGRQIRQLLAVRADPVDPGALALLFAADRLDHNHTVVLPALRAGEIDRYLMSSLAYQGLTHSVSGSRPSTPGRPRRTPSCWRSSLLACDASPSGGRATAGAGDPRRTGDPAPARQDLGPIQVIDGAEKISAVSAAVLRACVERGL